MSLFLVCFITDELSNISFHAAYSILLLGWDIQHLHCVEDHLSKLKCLLNSAEDTRTTRSILTWMSAWSNRPLTVPDICSSFTTESVFKWMGIAGPYTDIYTTHIYSSLTSASSFESKIFSYFMMAWGYFWLNISEKWTQALWSFQHMQKIISVRLHPHLLHFSHSLAVFQHFGLL